MLTSLVVRMYNSRLALSAVGQQQDVDTIAKQYQENWWLRELAARNLSAVWLRSYYPHNYEITGKIFFTRGTACTLPSVPAVVQLWLHRSYL